VLLDLGLVRAIRLLWIAWLLLLPAVAQAQFTYTTNNGAITITVYTGPGGNVTIPDTTNGLLVTCIGDEAFNVNGNANITGITIPDSVTNLGMGAFSFCTGLTSVTIPNSITSLGTDLFASCHNLTNVSIPDSITSIGSNTFNNCFALQNVTIPDSVTNLAYSTFYDCTSLIKVTIGAKVANIGEKAFFLCSDLTEVTLPGSVTSIGTNAFWSCSRLTSAYFKGNAPAADSSVFSYCNYATVYYLPGTVGWSSTFGGRPTALWFLPNPMILNFEPNFGVQTNGFGFTISWATNIPVVVEACTNFVNPAWQPVATNTLTNGSFYFSDPQWTNYPGRFYRLRSP
jgi:hypothetical protein